jgi:hypothetical protein
MQETWELTLWATLKIYESKIKVICSRFSPSGVGQFEALANAQPNSLDTNGGARECGRCRNQAGLGGKVGVFQP